MVTRQVWQSLGNVPSLVSVLGNVVGGVLIAVAAVVAALAVNGALAISVYWCGVTWRARGLVSGWKHQGIGDEP